MRIHRKGGYSSQEYQKYFAHQVPRVLLGEGLEVRLKFDNTTGRPVDTGEIDSKRLWVYFPGMGVQTIKLPANYELSNTIEDMTEIELINPEACVVNSRIYVRATGVKVK